MKYCLLCDVYLFYSVMIIALVDTSEHIMKISVSHEKLKMENIRLSLPSQTFQNRESRHSIKTVNHHMSHTTHGS